MRRPSKVSLMIAVGVGALVAASATAVPADAGHGGRRGTLKPVIDLSGPRGVDNVGKGKTLVTEDDGTFSLVVERKHKAAKKIVLGSVGAPGFANAISADRTGKVYILTGGGEPGTGAATLYKWRHGLGRAQAASPTSPATRSPTPTRPTSRTSPRTATRTASQPLKHGAALVADAAGNDLLKVRANGRHQDGRARSCRGSSRCPRASRQPTPRATRCHRPVRRSRLKVSPPRSRSAPTATTTSVSCADSRQRQARRRSGGSTRTANNAVCDWEHPYKGKCKLYKTGFTSIVDLASDRKGNIYVLELDQASWLALELGVGRPRVACSRSTRTGTCGAGQGPDRFACRRRRRRPSAEPST